MITVLSSMQCPEMPPDLMRDHRGWAAVRAQDCDATLYKPSGTYALKPAEYEPAPRLYNNRDKPEQTVTLTTYDRDSLYHAYHARA